MRKIFKSLMGIGLIAFIMGLPLGLLCGCAHRPAKPLTQPKAITTTLVVNNLRDVSAGVIQARNHFDRIDNKAVIILKHWND
ncbi:MAG: hypothetical protein ABI615_03995 [Chthoniobacterales bacterium]